MGSFGLRRGSWGRAQWYGGHGRDILRSREAGRRLRGRVSLRRDRICGGSRVFEVERESSVVAAGGKTTSVAGEDRMCAYWFRDGLKVGGECSEGARVRG